MIDMLLSIKLYTREPVTSPKMHQVMWEQRGFVNDFLYFLWPSNHHHCSLSPPLFFKKINEPFPNRLFWAIGVFLWETTSHSRTSHHCSFILEYRRGWQLHRALMLQSLWRLRSDAIWADGQERVIRHAGRPVFQGQSFPLLFKPLLTWLVCSCSQRLTACQKPRQNPRFFLSYIHSMMSWEISFLQKS